jgi:hypothetical protein
MINIVSYIAGGGGNHLKNILCLCSSFANSADLDQTAYDSTRQPPGTVHSVPGRNVRPDIIDRMVQAPDNKWLLHGHWGELMPYRSHISSGQNKWLLLTIDTEQDRNLIKTRHMRLHQHPHPYWLDEEQLYLYQPDMYQLYFGADSQNIFQLSLTEFWHPNLDQYQIIPRINKFFELDIDPVKAQQLHNSWWKMNFCFEFDSTVRRFYNRPLL